MLCCVVLFVCCCIVRIRAGKKFLKKALGVSAIAKALLFAGACIVRIALECCRGCCARTVPCRDVAKVDVCHVWIRVDAVTDGIFERILE